MHQPTHTRPKSPLYSPLSLKSVLFSLASPICVFLGGADDADDGGVYEVPNASSKKRVDVDDDDDGLTSGYVEHVRK